MLHLVSENLRNFQSKQDGHIVSRAYSVGVCHYIFLLWFSQDLLIEIGDNSLTLLHIYNNVSAGKGLQGG